MSAKKIASADACNISAECQKRYAIITHPNYKFMVAYQHVNINITIKIINMEVYFMSKINIDDGCNPELAIGAQFDGNLEIPILNPPNDLSIPSGLTPFSKRKYALGTNNAICFFEHEHIFSNILKQPNMYLKDLTRFKFVISMDNSLYIDAPLAVQVTNLYRRQIVSSYLQRNGINIIPLVRWGNDLTFTTKYFPEKIAFLGIPKESIVAIGSYGCLKKKIHRHIFAKGLAAMMETLNPKIILVYGGMPVSIFGQYMSKARFIQYPDWISNVHRRTI